MIHIFTITVDTEWESGKFAPGDEIAGQILEVLEQANPDQVDGVGADCESIYSIVTWDVEEQPRPEKPKKKRRVNTPAPVADVPAVATPVVNVPGSDAVRE